MSTVRSRWSAKVAVRKGLLAYARRQAAYWHKQKAAAKTPSRASHAGYMLDKREAKVAHRKGQLAYAQRVVANHPVAGTRNSRKDSFGIDWAWGVPNIAAMHKAGVRFAARYLSYDKGKNLTAAQSAALHAAGIDRVVVWETTADRARHGYNAGVSDAANALLQAQAAGLPADRPIYFAVDFDGQAAQVTEYFRGAAHVLGRERVGVYGSYSIVEGLLAGQYVRWAWQTYAWSRGKVSSRAHLYQYSNGHQLGGVSCDYNKALRDDFGQW